MRRRRTEQGSLVATLFVISFVLVVAFSLTLMSYQHWLFGRREHRRLVAHYLAESAAATAVAKLVQGDSLGPDKTAHRGIGVEDDMDGVVVTTAPDGPPLTPTQALTALKKDKGGGDGIGYVCFSPTIQRTYKLDYLSRQNTTKSGVEGEGGIPVPSDAALVVAHAACHGEEATVETVVYVPPFPLALLSSGPIQATGRLEVTGLRDPLAFKGDVAAIPASKRARVNVVSNSNAGTAIDLQGGAAVYGSLQAVGGIKVARNGFVTGAVRPYSDAEEIPDLKVDEKINAVLGHQYALAPSSSAAGLSVDWLYATGGSFSVFGDLVLEGGTLAVGGDLRVTGSVRGDGCVLVKGSTTIEGGAALSADNAVALMSRGPITLRGRGRTNSYIQGLVYSESSVLATRLTIVGALITNNTRNASRSGEVTLDDVTLVASPVATKKKVPSPYEAGVDDDQTIYFASASIDPTDPTGQRKVINATAIAYWNKDESDRAVPYDAGNVGRFRSTSVDAIVNGIVEYDKSTEGSIGALLVENVGNNITSCGAEGRLRDYIAGLLRGESPNTLIDIDLNRILKSVKRTRILMWRPR